MGSSTVFNSLPEDLQQILVEENQKAALATSRYILGPLADEQRENLRAQGMTIVEAHEIDKDAFGYMTGSVFVVDGGMTT